MRCWARAAGPGGEVPEELEALDSALVTEAIKDVLPESNGIQWDDIAGAAAAAAAAICSYHPASHHSHVH